MNTLSPVRPWATRPDPQCGHLADDRVPDMITATRLDAGTVSTPPVLRISAGDRQLSRYRCPECERVVGYRYLDESAGTERLIGANEAALQGALYDIIDQPAVDVFEIDCADSRLVVPRHHLPLFTVQRPAITAQRTLAQEANADRRHARHAASRKRLPRT
jgi:hypothetical protein